MAYNGGRFDDSLMAIYCIKGLSRLKRFGKQHEKTYFKLSFLMKYEKIEEQFISILTNKINQECLQSPPK